MTDFLTETLALEAKAAQYGTRYEGTLVGQAYHSQVEQGDDYRLCDLPKGSKVTRIRMIGGDYIPGRGKCYDISYVHATLPDGRIVRVNTSAAPEWALIPRRNLKKAMIDWAKAEGVFAKGLGMLDDGVYSILG